MSSAEEKQYEVTLGEQFVSNLREYNSKTKQMDRNNGFAIRYTVPPDSLQTDKNSVNLRKTTRGEYIIERTNQPESSDTPNNGTQASFKGTGTQTRETECVLIFNPNTNKYELHTLGLDIQVSPVLKSRLRSQAQAGVAQNENPTNGALRDRLSAARSTSKTASPVKNSTNSVTPPSQNNSASSSKAISASLAPKRTTKARLPTRKKLTPKPNASKLKGDGEEGPFSEVKAPTPDLSRSSRYPSVEPHVETVASNHIQHSNRPTLSSHFQNQQDEQKQPQVSKESLNTIEETNDTSHNASTIHIDQKNTPVTLPQNIIQPPPSEQAEVDGFDDSFNDLADELADELGEDDDDVEITALPQKSTWSAGTAGTFQDEDEVSSEEE